MVTFRVKHKVDATQPAIVGALRAAGYAVCQLDQGGGCPDLLVARGSQGRCPLTHAPAKMWLLEVKTPGGVLTPAQKAWVSNWPVPVYVVRTPEEALEAVGGT